MSSSPMRKESGPAAILAEFRAQGCEQSLRQTG
jgi:hypothetical protein